MCRVVWSRRQPFASVGAVLSLLDSPSDCDPAFCVVWFRFRLLRRYLALWPFEVGRAYRLLDMVSEGCRGHGPVHLLVSSAAEIGFHCHALAWVRPVFLYFVIWQVLYSIFRLLFLMLGRTRLQLIFVAVRVFVVVPCRIFVVLCSFLTLLMSGIVIKVCYVVFWLEVLGWFFVEQG